MVPLACGSCTDSQLVTVPFFFYWLIAYFLWSVPIGIPLGIAAHLSGAPLRLNPPRFFFGAFFIGILMGLPLGGTVALPYVLILPVWMFRLAQNARPGALATADGGPPPRAAVFAARVNRAFLVILVLLVPVSYARLHLQESHPEMSLFKALAASLF